MNFTEVLKVHNLTDEQIVKISADMKANKIFLAAEENLDIRYQKLQLESEQTKVELTKSQALIAELQKGNKGNEDLQKQIDTYKADIVELQKQNEAQKVDNAINRLLLENNVQDIDYVKYKIKEGKTELKLDDKGNIDNSSALLESLKTQLPSQFSKVNKVVNENKLPSGDNSSKGITKEDFKRMNYKDRVELYNTNKELYDSLQQDK